MKNDFKLPSKKNLSHHFFLSFAVVFSWMLVARNEYNYNYNFPEIFGISLLPLIAGIIGLFFVYYVYYFSVQLLNNRSIIKDFLFFTVIYWFALILAETAGYYLLGVHNLAGAGYPPLPICHCIHAPVWMQAAYFLIGPIYLAICILLNLDSAAREPSPSRRAGRAAG